MAVINSLHELKNIDIILQKDEGKERERELNWPLLWKCKQEEDADTTVRSTNHNMEGV